MRLVAVARFPRDFFALGDRRNHFRVRLFSTSGGARISRALWHHRPSTETVLLLFAASAAQTFSLERFDDCAGDCRSSRSPMEAALDLARNFARDFVAHLLGFWRAAGDVVDSVETGRSDLPGNSAALFAAGGADQKHCSG